MTKPLSSSVTRQLLRRAVALLDDARIMADDREWCIANDVFLDDLKAALGVPGTIEAVAALTPKPKYRNHKAERAIRYAAIVIAYQKDGATLASVAKEFGMGVTGVHRIYHEWRRKNAKQGEIIEPLLERALRLSSQEKL